MWDFTQRNAREQAGMEPNHFIISLDGGHLIKPVIRPYREFSEAMQSAFINAFRAADQSGEARGLQSMLNSPFVLDIAAVQTTGRRPMKTKDRKKIKQIDVREFDWKNY